ncbi:MAG: COQ9 family protein [Dongiaceae bacterium]
MTTDTDDGMESGEALPEHERRRETLLLAALPHVPFDGWTQKALGAGARDAGIDPALAADAFPGGAGEMIEFFNQWADRRAVAELEAVDLGQLKVRQRIALGVRRRIEANAPYREAIRLGLAHLTLPQNMPLASKVLYRTVDALWYAAGDTATDFNFYTKRGLLAGVYGATVLYWLNDKSPGSAESWAFLERRIADVMRIPPAMARFGRIGALLPNPLRLLRPLRR